MALALCIIGMIGMIVGPLLARTGFWALLLWFLGWSVLCWPAFYLQDSNKTPFWLENGPISIVPLVCTIIGCTIACDKVWTSDK